MPQATDKPKRTLSPEQKMKMAVSSAKKAAKELGLPDPFPNGVPSAKVEPPKQPQTAPGITAQPQAVGRVGAALPADAPAEPPHYGPHDVVRVFNPDNEAFNFQFGTKHSLDGKGRVIDASIEPIMYTVPAGQAISMHGYMADYVCNHLTSRILQKLGQVRQINSPIVRKAWAAKIILGKEDIITPEAKLSEAEQVQKKFNEINANSNPVSEDEGEIPLAEADELLNDIDQETLENEGGEFPDANAPTA